MMSACCPGSLTPSMSPRSASSIVIAETPTKPLAHFINPRSETCVASMCNASIPPHLEEIELPVPQSPERQAASAPCSLLARQTDSTPKRRLHDAHSRLCAPRLSLFNSSPMAKPAGWPQQQQRAPCVTPLAVQVAAPPFEAICQPLVPLPPSSPSRPSKHAKRVRHLASLDFDDLEETAPHLSTCLQIPSVALAPTPSNVSDDGVGP